MWSTPCIDGSLESRKTVVDASYKHYHPPPSNSLHRRHATYRFGLILFEFSHYRILSQSTKPNGLALKDRLDLYQTRCHVVFYSRADEHCKVGNSGGIARTPNTSLQSMSEASCDNVLPLRMRLHFL